MGIKSFFKKVGRGIKKVAGKVWSGVKKVGAVVGKVAKPVLGVMSHLPGIAGTIGEYGKKGIEAVEKLVDDDRPLSKNGAISRLFEVRKPIYEGVCDKKVSNDGNIEETVREILSL